MMKHSRLLISMVCLALAGSEGWAGAGWTAYGTVAELTPTVQGRFIVRLDVAGNTSDCSSKDSFYRDYGRPGAELMFRTLLDAVTAGKRVRVYVTGACDLNGYSEITSVSLIP